MEKSLEKITYSVIELLTNFSQVNAELLEPEFIEDKIHDARNKMMNDLLRKNNGLDIAFYTLCDCIEVKCDEVECGEEKSGIIRKYSDIEYINTSFGQAAIRYLGPPDMSINYRRKGSMMPTGGQYTRHEPGYTIIGDKAYYENIPDEVGVVTILALTKNGSCLPDCDKTKPYNIPGHLIFDLEIMVCKAIFPSFRIPRDNKNNSNDDV